MKRECLRVEEAVWEASRNGEDTPENVRLHIAGCKSCANAFEEARRITQMLSESDRVPESPDCRPCVTALIFGGSRKKQVWSYALAGAAAVIVILAALATLKPAVHGPTHSTIVRKPARFMPKTCENRSVTGEKLSVIGPNLSVTNQNLSVNGKVRAKQLSVIGKHIARERTLWAHIRHPRVPKRVAVKKPETTPTTIAAAPIDPSRPVAVAVVSWDQMTEAESNSYEYKTTDADGRVTECKVVDTGDVVKISMASNL